LQLRWGGCRSSPPLQKLGIPGPPRRVLLTRGINGGAPEILRLAKKVDIPPSEHGPSDPNAVSPAEFAKMLQSIRGPSVCNVEVPCETHESMVSARPGRGMRWTLMG
jgi:hypothetical protein